MPVHETVANQDSHKLYFRIIISHQLKANNYRFNIDQSVGSAQDGFVLSYNNSTGEIELEPSGGGGLSDSTWLFGGVNPDTLYANISSTGKIGIGTDTPEELLHLQATADPAIKLTESGGTANHLSISNINASTAKFDKTAASGSALLDFFPNPEDGTSTAKTRFFRNTNTTGRVALDIHKGDNTSGVNCSLSGNDNSYVNKSLGNFGVGISAPTEKLHVKGKVKIDSLIADSLLNIWGDIGHGVGRKISVDSFAHGITNMSCKVMGVDTQTLDGTYSKIAVFGSSTEWTDVVFDYSVEDRIKVKRDARITIRAHVLTIDAGGDFARPRLKIYKNGSVVSVETWGFARNSNMDFFGNT